MVKALTKSSILEEIHATREQMTQETKNMSPQEEVEYWNRGNQKSLLEDGYRYVMTKKGLGVLQRVG